MINASPHPSSTLRCDGFVCVNCEFTLEITAERQRETRSRDTDTASESSLVITSCLLLRDSPALLSDLLTYLPGGLWVCVRIVYTYMHKHCASFAIGLRVVMIANELSFV